MSLKIYKFHSDPGHGWLEVPREEVDRLGLAEKISRYSYQSIDGKRVFLEEDCDMGVLFLALADETGAQKSESGPCGYDESELGIQVRPQPSRIRHSWIRSLPGFQA